MTKKKTQKKPAPKKPAKKPAGKAKNRTAGKAKNRTPKTRQSPTVAVTQPKRTYITFVLDYSGSMQNIRAETIEHVNEQIEAIIADSKGQETHVSLVTFNSQVECKFFNATLDKLKPLTLKTYNPDGWTAMLDGVGYAVERMVSEIPELEDENSAALVVVVSDGLENSSKKWDRPRLGQLIRKLQDTKRWTFSYLGANQDLAIIEDMGIPKGNICAFVADAAGMRNATAMSVQSTSSYLAARNRGETQSTNYYSPKS
jgi:Mg-chelatase subunit ChlD